MCGESSSFGWTHKGCLNPQGMYGLICVYEYQDEKVVKAIDELKFGFNREIVPIILKDFVFETGVAFDAIVPMPLHFYRENWRGFNQAEVISIALARKMGVPVEKWLKRVKITKQQSMLRNREERVRNMSDAFVLDQGKLAEEKSILLVDDVFTSGVSMREAAKTLKRGGAKFVWGLVLAH